MNAETALAAVAIEAVGATVQGTVGFGINLIVAPFLVLIDPRFAPGPVVLAGMVGSFFITWRERGTLDRPTVGWALLGRLPGTVLGTLVVTLTTAGKLRPMVGIAVLIGVALTLPRRGIKRSRASLVGIGAVSGVMGTIAGLGGAPFGLICHDLPAPVLRPTVSAFVAVGAALSGIALILAGRLGGGALELTAFLLPGVGLGFALSTKLLGKVDQRFVRVGVLIIATAGGLAAVLSGLT